MVINEGENFILEWKELEHLGHLGQHSIDVFYTCG
jgi:hypothetical protein